MSNSNRPSTPITKIPNSPRNKNLTNKTIPPLILPKSLVHQTGVNSPSDFSDNESDWQTVQPNTSKRSRSPNSCSPITKKPDKNIFISANRFSPIAPPNEIQPMETSETNTNSVIKDNENKTSKPPPIFIHEQIIYKKFCQKIKELTDDTGFDCKSSTKGLKLQTYSPDSYRSVVAYLKNNNVSFHSFQLKEEKAYRVVIRNMHHSTDTSFIKQELLDNGFISRNIMPVTNKLTNTPLPIFFIDLEPSPTNSDIFKLTSLCYTKIKVETPRPKKEIPQCHRCQAYGHTRGYCNHSPRCVRCGEHHESIGCTKDRNSPAKCALCSGNHPANFRGCQTHLDLKKRLSENTSRKTWNKSSSLRQPIGSNSFEPTHQAYSQNFPPLNQDTPSHSQDTNSNHNQNQNISAQLSSFIIEFKALINPLISLLTTVIDKLIKNANE